MSNSDSENIFFSLEDNDNDNNNVNEIDLNLIYNEIENYDLENNDTFDMLYYQYKLNYTVKELLLICEYYGISKELKSNKCNKEIIVQFIIDFESNPINDQIVLKRQKMWDYINELKNDKFMKKYVIW